MTPISALPKIELHLHLDCSLSYDVVHKINPKISLSDYEQSFIAPPKCHDLADFLTRAIQGIELMQTEENLRMVTLDLFEQLLADRVIYAEMRFAPLEHIHQGLKPNEVVEIVEKACEEGVQKTGVHAGVILCTLRHYTEEQSMQVIQLVEQFMGTRVVGFDIAADEAGFPIDAHVKAFHYAHAKGIPCTAHAGEARGPKSVWETLEHFKPSRIGHGVRSIEDPGLIQHLKDQGIHLEVCPNSNLQTNMYERIIDHPADRLFREGVSMSINCDARTITNTNLIREYSDLQSHFNWTPAHFLTCNKAAIDAAFTSQETKQALLHQLEQAYPGPH